VRRGTRVLLTFSTTDLVDFVHPYITHCIADDLLVTKGGRFIANQSLMRELYCAQSAVETGAFLVFVTVLEGNAFDVTEWNEGNCHTRAMSSAWMT
jgi:hypothetical protein